LRTVEFPNLWAKSGLSSIYFNTLDIRTVVVDQGIEDASVAGRCSTMTRNLQLFDPSPKIGVVSVSRSGRISFGRRVHRILGLPRPSSPGRR
jgi:hypothetical protein